MLVLFCLFPLIQSSCPKDEFSVKNEKSRFTLPKLPYQYNSLNPHYWDQILYYHHDKIHSDLVTSLNSYIASNPKYLQFTITELLVKYAASDYMLWRYAGAHYSHSLFWWSLYSYKCADPLGNSSELLYDIQQKWKSFAAFKNEFNKNAKGLYGSGWVWLCLENGSLVIKAKTEEYNPLGQGLIPIVGIDVWEHSYEFFYRWDRESYVDAWWEIVDWGLITYLYQEYCKKGLPIPI